MTKSKKNLRISNSTTGSNQDNGQSRKFGVFARYYGARGRAALSTQDGFTTSMPKLVQGVAYLQPDNELIIDIRYKKDNEYDKIVNILDSDNSRLNPEFGNEGNIILSYTGWRKQKASSKTLHLIFASGFSKSITLTVPGRKSKLRNKVNSITSSLSSSPYQNLLAADTGQSTSNKLFVGVYPKADPYDVFNYKGVFVYNLPFVFYINSDSIAEALLNAGVSSNNPNVTPGKSTRGVGHLFPGEAEQEIHFVNSFSSDAQEIQNRNEILNGLNNASFSYGFIYGSNLFDIPDHAPIFHVCKNEGDSSFFRTTKKDCNGETIRDSYLYGEEPAVFIDGHCCSINCDSLSITVKNSSDSDYGKVNALMGSAAKITVTVTGGQGDFIYNITQTNLGINTTTSSAESEYEFTGIAFDSSQTSPYKLQVTDANGCVAISYIHLSRDVNEGGLVEGCTDSNSFVYDSNAVLNTGCLYCKTLGPRGERYDGLAFGTTSASSKPTGEDLISVEHSRITHAVAVNDSSGKIYFRGAVHPVALPKIASDSDASYRLTFYDLGATDNANSLTKAQIVALSGSNVDGDLIHEWTGLKPGWYAVTAKILNVPTLDDCISLYRFKVGHAGCMKPSASNYDITASYNRDDLCEYNCPEKNIKIKVSNTDVNCVKTVAITKAHKDDNITWKIGSTEKKGQGPHLAEADSFITVYIENSETKCTNSGDVYIPHEECIESPEAARRLKKSKKPGSPMALLALSAGGCTDIHAFNYDCNALYDDGTCIPAVAGCTDPTSMNYNNEANIDDGSCLDFVEGCTYPSALNYNPLATTGGIELCNFLTQFDMNLQMNIGNAITCPPAADGNLNNFDTNVTNMLGVSWLPVPMGVTVQLGTKITAYQVPAGGINTINGLSVNDMTFPLEDSGWPAAATWTITKPDSFLLTADAGQPWLGNITPGLNAIMPLITWNDDGTFVATNTFNSVFYTPVNFPSDNGGTIGMGTYIFEYKLIYGGETRYYQLAQTVPSALLFGTILNCSVNDGFSPQLVGCNDPAASNYNPHVALSYTQLANFISWGDFVWNSTMAGQINIENPQVEAMGASICEYQGIKPCLPPRIDEQIKYLEGCIMNGSVKWYTNHITGGQDLCEDIALWTTILIKYLVSRKGLPCIFNCRDSGTPNITHKSCNDKWIDTGSKVWTHSGSPLYQGTGSYAMGDYVKFDDSSLLPWMGDGASNSIFVVNNNCGANCGNPFGLSGSNQAPQAPNNWDLCVEEHDFSEYTVNYLDNFFKFATRYCKSCSPCSFDNNTQGLTIGTDSFEYSDEEDSILTVGGIWLELNGDTFEEA